VTVYPIDNDEKVREINTIPNIAHNNPSPNQLIDNFIHKNVTNKPQTFTNHQKEKRKWVAFTFTGKEVYRITNILKKLNLGIAFKTSITIFKDFSIHPQPSTDSMFQLGGIYQLTCRDSKLQYVGQTGRQFHTRYK
jgi:hypothetical protein